MAPCRLPSEGSHSVASWTRIRTHVHFMEIKAVVHIVRTIAAPPVTVVLTRAAAAEGVAGGRRRETPCLRICMRSVLDKCGFDPT